MVQYPIPRQGPSRPVPMSALFPVIREVLELTGTYTLAVTGSSMEPFLRHLRDCAVFRLPDKRPIRRGDIVLFRREDGGFELHRVYAQARDGAISAVGDAQWILENGIRPEQVLACVTHVVRNGCAVDCEQGTWRTIMTAYMVARICVSKPMRALLRIIHWARHIASAHQEASRNRARSETATR